MKQRARTAELSIILVYRRTFCASLTQGSKLDNSLNLGRPVITSFYGKLVVKLCSYRLLQILKCPITKEVSFTFNNSL